MESTKTTAFKSVDFMRTVREKLTREYLDNPEKYRASLAQEMKKFKSHLMAVHPKK